MLQSGLRWAHVRMRKEKEKQSTLERYAVSAWPQLFLLLSSWSLRPGRALASLTQIRHARLLTGCTAHREIKSEGEKENSKNKEAGWLQDCWGERERKRGGESASGRLWALLVPDAVLNKSHMTHTLNTPFCCKRFSSKVPQCALKR